MIRIGRTAIVITLLLAGSAFAQQQPPASPAAPPPVDFSKVEIKTTDLGDNVYMLEGQGGNITVAVGKAGIIMVDGQFAPLHDKIKAAISTISSLPIKYLINTHYHGDHTGGNEAFAKDGATIVSDVNVKYRLADGTSNGLTGGCATFTTEPYADAAFTGFVQIGTSCGSTGGSWRMIVGNTLDGATGVVISLQTASPADQPALDTALQTLVVS
jgi:hypothetical protein